MRIALCSTFPPQRCGIATYTQNLAKVLVQEGHEVLIVAERADVADVVNGPPIQVIRAWDRKTNWVKDIVDALRSVRVDLAHIQHVPGILALDGSLGELCRRLRGMGIATVTTLHSVHTLRSAYLERLFDVRSFYRSLAEHCDATIVHQEQTALSSLRRNGLAAERIAVIPHGTSELERPSKETARAKLGLPSDGPLFLLFGYIHPQKNSHTIVRAMNRVTTDEPARLLIVGSLQNAAWYNKLYLEAVKRLAERNGHGSRIELRLGFVADDDVPLYFAASDLVLLPYWQAYGSASGVLHTSLGANRPVMVSHSPKFGDVARILGSEFCAPTGDAEGWATRLDAVVRNPDLLREASKRLAAYAGETSWENVGKKTSELYARVLERVS
jgi:glycosyltransferase involved in cell wall biosynthesis